MVVDKFGKISRKEEKITRGRPGIGFILTSDGNFDLQNKLIKNLNDPVDKNDAVTKQFLKNELNELLKKLEDLSKTVTTLEQQFSIKYKINDEKLNKPKSQTIKSKKPIIKK